MKANPQVAFEGTSNGYNVRISGKSAFLGQEIIKKYFWKIKISLSSLVY